MAKYIIDLVSFDVVCWFLTILWIKQIRSRVTSLVHDLQIHLILYHLIDCLTPCRGQEVKRIAAAASLPGQSVQSQAQIPTQSMSE